MRVMLIELKVESPLVLTRRFGKYGFSTVRDWIPGSTLRGALLSGAVEFGYLDPEEAAAESNEPACVIHPGYPSEGGSASRPATPFVHVCKADGALVDVLGRDGIPSLTRSRSPREMLAPVRERPPESLCGSLRGIPGAAKPITGAPVYRSADGSLRVAEVRKDIFTSVSINKTRRAAERGMLYSYEAILPGATFSFLAICRDEVGEFVNRERVLFLGRGVSRGFGRCSLRPLKEWEMEAAVSRLSDAASEWIVEVDGVRRLAAYARSPVTRLVGWGVSSPVPAEADTERLGLKGEVVMRVAKGDDGRPLQIGGLTTFRSFSSVTGLPRPDMTCSERGSILILELIGPERDLQRAVALAALLGWDILASLGLNVVYPLGWWYDDPVGG